MALLGQHCSLRPPESNKSVWATPGSWSASGVLLILERTLAPVVRAHPSRRDAVSRLPIQGHGPHQIPRLQGEKPRGRLCQTYAVPTDLDEGSVKAPYPRVGQQDHGAYHGGWQIQADQGTAALDGLHLFQGGAVMGAAVERINGVEVVKAR